MKKIFLILAIITAFNLNTFAGPEVSVKIEWGKPSKNCTGFGICKISITASWNFATAATIQDNNGNFTITVSENELASKAPDKLQYFKGKNFVEFDEEIIIPSEISKAAGYIGTLKIHKGSYKIEKNTKGDYVIIIPIK